MEKDEILKMYEDEYMNEIQNIEVGIEELQKLGVSDKTLACEVYLRKIYGSDIMDQESTDESEIKGKKQIIRLGDIDFSENNNFKLICNDIENSEFDKNLDIILH